MSVFCTKCKVSSWVGGRTMVPWFCRRKCHGVCNSLSNISAKKRPCLCMCMGACMRAWVCACVGVCVYGVPRKREKKVWGIREPSLGQVRDFQPFLILSNALSFKIFQSSEWEETFWLWWCFQGHTSKCVNLSTFGPSYATLNRGGLLECNVSKAVPWGGEKSIRVILLKIVSCKHLTKQKPLKKTKTEDQQLNRKMTKKTKGSFQNRKGQWILNQWRDHHLKHNKTKNLMTHFAGEGLEAWLHMFGRKLVPLWWKLVILWKTI